MRRIFIAPLTLMLLCFALSTAHAQQVFKTTTASVIGYLEYVPQDYNTNSDKYPVMIFLHGIGERGANSTDPAVLATTINAVAKNGPPMYVKNGTQFSFILISPQLKNNLGDWPTDYVLEVINYVKTYLRIDERRIYLTGLSLGGGGTWWTAQDHPELFAAIAPVCGSRNNPALACNIAGENLPVWAFHGDADTTVPLAKTVNMVNDINACLPTPNPLAKVTIYPGVGHSAWVYAYRTDHSLANPNLYDWITSYTNVKNHGNAIPIANAGADKTGTPGSPVNLTGSASDADGAVASYSWTQIGGPNTATISNKLASSVTITNTVAGTYFFRLTVTDNSGNTDSDYVQVAVSGSGSTLAANAGADKSITLPTNSVTVAGSATDAGGTVTTYAWTKVSGGAATLNNSNTATMSAASLTAGSYTFRLTVTDNAGKSASDDMTVTVNSSSGTTNILPVANGGPDRTLTLPTNSISITGTGTDQDGTISSYMWIKASGPMATLSNTTSPTLTASGLIAGSYTFRFTVMDNRGAKSSDDVIVTVNAAGTTNVSPVANAGADKSITLPTNSLTLTGSGTDSDGTISSYAWTEISGAAATLSGANTAALSVSALTAGNYVFRLTVTDDKGAKASDDVSVSVVSSGNTPPIAKAGGDQSIMLPTNSATLSGSGSDPGGKVTSLHWTQVSGNAATLSGVYSGRLSVSGLTAGNYVFRLTVTDDQGATASDDATVTVTSAANTLPVANAGSDRSITLPTNSITLTGSATDADGTIAAYSWTKISGNAATLSGATSSTLTASGLTAGTYVFRLTVTDNAGGSSSSDVTVTVNPSTNQAPTAKAGADKSITLPTNTATILGSGSDSDGAVASVGWTKMSGGAATLSGIWSATLKVSGLTGGTYVFRLTVTDNLGATSYDDMTLTVNADPTASAASLDARVSSLSENEMETLNTGSSLLASADESGLGNTTRAQLEKATVVIFNPAGERIYAGRWDDTVQREVMSGKGLYIYNVITDGKRTDAGKIYIRD